MVSIKSSTKIVKFMASVYGVQILGRGQYMSVMILITLWNSLSMGHEIRLFIIKKIQGWYVNI